MGKAAMEFFDKALKKINYAADHLKKEIYNGRQQHI